MNQRKFNQFMKKENRPSQHKPEMRMFLEICETYLKEHKIKDPIAVELGIWRNRQKKFYEELLGVKHIGIDVSKKRGRPDIRGNTHDPETIRKLKEILNGRPINILFIDASHIYEDVKKDYELYSPLCPDIIAFHDIETHRFDPDKKELGVWRFWDELKNCEDHLFISIQSIKNRMGIGVVIKR